MPDVEPGTLCEMILTPSVFDQARPDLLDLRLYDAADREVPFAVQIRSPRHDRVYVTSKEFNRATGVGESRELTLDLLDKVSHDEIEVVSPGSDYHRRIVLEGSDNGEDWKQLLDSFLVRYAVDDVPVERRRLNYATSRFQYLRIRLYPDSPREKEPPPIESVQVYRHENMPGEFLWTEAELSPREPVRAAGRPGSAWMLSLGGRLTPCDRLEFQIAGGDFYRDYYLERSLDETTEPRPSFSQFHYSNWQRKPGERKPLVSEFGEIATSRIRLVVMDDRNSPLRIESVRYRAAVRAVVFAANKSLQGPLYLYYGHPKAEPTGYDFARNLPAQLPSPAKRLTLGDRESNPGFVPPPKPFTERWPWAVYVVLSVAVAVLGVLILGLARSAIAASDRRAAATPA